MTSLRSAAAAALLALAACQEEPPEAPWLTMPTASSHLRDFPIDRGAHDGLDCDACHGGTSTFAEFHCTSSCHAQAEADAGHVGIDGYRWESAGCYGCHPDGAGVDHAPIFPISAASAHETAGCAECHLDPADRTRLGCAGCHPHAQDTMATAHAQVGGYAFDSALCVRCHADAQVDRIAAHLPFGIGVGFDHRAGREAGECLRCHPFARADKPFGQLFATAECLGCHERTEMDGKHAGRSGYAYDTPTCLTAGCHQDGRKP